MKAGTLRHRITIQERTETRDAIGGFSETWATLSGNASVPAAIWPIKSAEALDAQKLENQVTHRIRIRYRSGITTKHRIVFGSRTFQIVSLMNPDERNIMLDMLTTEDI